jgi:hypothetical protein
MFATITNDSVRRWYFCALGAVHLIALVSLAVQVRGLVGEQGILPASAFFQLAFDRFGSAAYFKLPTLCWLNAGDAMLLGLCLGGMALAIALIAGFAPRVVLLSLWALYLSLCVAGQAFLSFQWDTLLLETTLCSVLYAPRGWRPAWTEPPLPIAKWLVWALAFKLMLLSGATKLLSGDDTWTNGTALNFHYYTQPIPNGISWHVHHLPQWFQAASLRLMFLVELVLPLFVFAGRWGRAAFAAGTMLLMALIELTGNYGFFNLLTMVLCLPLLDEQVLRCCWRLCRVGCAHQCQSADVIGGHSPPYESLSRPTWRVISANVLGGAMLFVSLLSFVEELAHTRRGTRIPAAVSGTLDVADRALLSWGEPWILDRLAPLRTINGYGLFRVMTTKRPEIVIEYTHDGATWHEYEFPYKTGRVDRRPPLVAPHMPRLDWQMWFAALNPRGNAYWLSALAERILEGNPQTAALLARPDIAAHPPQAVRFVNYDYVFSTPAERRESGAWWSRARMGELTGPLTRSL